MPIASTDPNTGQTWQTYDEISPAKLENKLQKAVEGFEANRHASFEMRAKNLTRAAELLRERKEELARLAVREMGKLIQPARDEVEKCAVCCDYYAKNGAGFLADEPVDVSPAKALVRYQPLGPVLAVMPWNFPYWQVFRFAAPGLMAGNAGLLKHASNVPGCALAIEQVLSDAGFPEGAFQTLLLSASKTSEIMDDQRVAAATLTGSEPAGARIAGVSGTNIKKTVLELGGSDPFIVMPSADLEKAVATAVKARMINNGQSCIAAKRFIIHEEIYEAFREGFVAQVKALKMGDPLDEATTLGPLATTAIRDDLHEQVQTSVEAGARLLCGGSVPEGAGFFYPGTVLESIPETAPAFGQETFGPVASLFRVPNRDAAVELANGTEFGLGASAWTRDDEEREFFTREIAAGSVFINAMVASDPRVPFGGIKKSGYGRELSVQGIREFVNVKTVWISA